MMDCAHRAEIPEVPAFYAALTMTGDQKDTATPSDSGLYQRMQSGAWQPVGPRILGVSSLAIHPMDPMVRLIPCSDGIARSADGGMTWRKTTGWEVADARTIAFDTHRPNHVYAATLWGPWRSVDAGVSWIRAHVGLDRLYNRTLLADRNKADRVLAGMEDGVYLSEDGAHSWTRMDFPTVALSRLVQHRHEAEIVIATTVGRGAWLSRDAGNSWAPVDPTTQSANLYAAALCPTDPSLLAFGGWEMGVRLSEDGGRTWRDGNEGLPNRRIFVLAFDPRHPGRLWASTFEAGSYFTDDRGRRWQEGGLRGAYGSDFVFEESA